MVTLGEGWHNNHHHYPAAARNGFFWWEIDITYYTLKLLEACGIIWDLRQVPPELLEEHLLQPRVARPAVPTLSVADALRATGDSVRPLSELVRDTVMEPRSGIGEPEPAP
jgi:hypothetical protein